jgi:DNA-binding MarR family transcriptional regulator
MASRAAARKRQEPTPPRTTHRPAVIAGFALDADDTEIDRLIYGRVRLGIMSALAVNEPLTFNDLKTLFEVTDGNLSAHARKLEDAGYISCRKSFEARRPKSEYRLTSAGRKALNRYLEHIEAVIKATRRT